MITINRKTYFFKNNMIFIVVLKGASSNLINTV